jgi:hypothetical protein
VVEDIAGQQMLMGWGMKTLHDFPVIDRDLTVAGVPIFPTIGDRKIEVSLRPVTPEETVTFWSTDQMRTARLSAYYEVRTVLLPPESATGVAGIVGDFALGARAGGRPTLGATASLQRFTLAPALGGATLAARLSPAVVALKAGAPDADMRMTVAGNGLGDGSDLAVVLRGDGLPAGMTILAPAANVGWEILATDRELGLTVRPQAQARTDAGVQPVAILPGFYTIAVRRAQRPRTETGLERPGESESNRTVFAVAPFVLTSVLDGANHVIVTVEAAYNVEDPAAPPQLSIGGEVYRRVAAFAGNATDQGAFLARNGNIYEAVPLFDPTIVPRTYPVRLSVNGVDAPPLWMQVL